ncbi:MAG: DNA phosphorothioation system sulfurtransferase DndC [Oscillospiraceae bacterium]|nr:DNA phosphorothioation system sulfurtransferase DndC [Oscillospiraceae bacterium]
MFEEYRDIKEEMKLVYLHDKRPWMIGYSGGKDSTLLCQLVFEMLLSLPEYKRWKPVYIVTSDTLVENPIIKKYMHRMSAAINHASEEQKLNVQAHMIYPETRQTFWSLVIGLGYPTPEPPGFRWCTERLKINPSNAFTYNTIKKDGEIVILLGVRKAESAARSRSISSREIEGKILVPHEQIPKAYVYSPLADVKNENVWEYLLKSDGKSAWGTDNNYLYSLYQGENLGEEDSVVGQVNKDNMKVTGNSRFGCWICTMVKEDKSLKNFIDHGATELIPLRDFRNWLVELRSNPEARDYRRRNGSVYIMANGEYGRGPFTMDARKEILRRLLRLENETGFDLISIEELKTIDKMWEDEGDLSRRALVDIYYEEKHERLPWDNFKKAKYDADTLSTIAELCEKHDVPFDLVSKLMISVDNTKFFTRSSVSAKNVERILNEGWLHFEAVKEGLENETK